ncbi:hypothetical protein ACRJ4W_31760 [Streptomyces sp. GLT-R25]
MKETAESVGSMDVEAGVFVRIGDRFGERVQRAGVHDALVRPVRVAELLELPQCVEEMPLVPDQGAVQQFTRSSCLGDRQSCQSGRRRRSGRHPAIRRALAPTSADDVIGKGKGKVKFTGINRSFVACGTDP